MRVLLIEDDPMIGRGLSKALGAEGMSVDWVRDGVDASAALAGCGHSIILLDLGLPDAEGLDLLKIARRNGLSTPVLVITARDALDDTHSSVNRALGA